MTRNADPAVIGPTLTIEHMTSDAEEVVRYLRTTYHKQKIFLLGHSWGSALAPIRAIGPACLDVGRTTPTSTRPEQSSATFDRGTLCPDPTLGEAELTVELREEAESDLCAHDDQVALAANRVTFTELPE